jgi:hypothetical protein
MFPCFHFFSDRMLQDTINRWIPNHTVQLPLILLKDGNHRTSIAMILQCHLLDEPESKSFVNSHVRRKLATLKITTQAILVSLLDVNPTYKGSGPSGKYVERGLRQCLSPDYLDDMPKYSKTSTPYHQSTPVSAFPPAVSSTSNISTPSTNDP